MHGISNDAAGSIVLHRRWWSGMGGGISQKKICIFEGFAEILLSFSAGFYRCFSVDLIVELNE
jgi:hypothetical protein